MNDKLFTRDFSLVVIGQIISLFGNSILRFALPLYLLEETGSASLFGIVTACSFIPMILLSPAGGIVADRVNKRNIMVILDYATSALILLFSAALGHVSLVLLLIITLMALYGIQGAYQPAVQASLPALLSPGRLLSGNAVDQSGQCSGQPDRAGSRRRSVRFLRHPPDFICEHRLFLIFCHNGIVYPHTV